MSDVMLFGVLKMPYEMAMASELSRLQFYQRVQQLIARVEAQPPLPVQAAEEWPGQSNIESIYNACQHRGYCKQLKAQPPLPMQEPVTDKRIRELFHKYGTSRLDGFTAAIKEAIEAALKENNFD